MTVRSDDAQMASLDVSRETNDRLTALVALLVKWNAAVNLVSKDTLSQVWQRHILDSAQIFKLGSGAKVWADLGSGGGFPGLVIAILAAEKAPLMQVVLVESDHRKAAFLAQASQSLGVHTKIIVDRIEKIEALNVDVVSARALAPLPLLCSFAARHLAPNGVAIFLKGRNFHTELASAQAGWNFSLESHASLTDPSAFVLVLKEIVHV